MTTHKKSIVIRNSCCIMSKCGAKVNALTLTNFFFIFMVRKCHKYPLYTNVGGVGVFIRNSILNLRNLHETSVIPTLGSEIRNPNLSFVHQSYEGFMQIPFV